MMPCLWYFQTEISYYYSLNLHPLAALCMVVGKSVPIVSGLSTWQQDYRSVSAESLYCIVHLTTGQQVCECWITVLQPQTKWIIPLELLILCFTGFSVPHIDIEGMNSLFQTSLPQPINEKPGIPFHRTLY